MSLLDNFPHRCTIRRRVRVKGSLGGSRDSTTDEQTDVECWEQQASASESEAYEKKGITVTSKVFYRTDPGVSRRHQILITERIGAAVANPDVLDVVSEPRPDASVGLGVVWRVMANRETGEDD